MDYFPLFLKVEGRTCVVVGGGAVAERKVAMLRRAGGRVSLLATKLTDGLADLAARGAIDHRARAFLPEHLDGAVLVIAATDDRGLNAQVARQARLRGLPVNVVDDAALSSYLMPAVIDRSPVLVAVSSGGASPVLARRLRARIEAALPSGIGRLAQLMGRYRDAARLHIPDPAARMRTWERVLDGSVARHAVAGRALDAEAAMLDALTDPADAGGEVHLVGAGPGDPELLTIKAHRLLECADVVVHDRLVGAAVLDLARRDAVRIDVGKRPGDHVMTQDEINDLLISLARAGKRVVRLKGGDPFVFGRGGEELAALAGAGVACRVVPGITAATGCAASAGIPLTLRDVARTCVFVTGHDRDGIADLDWDVLARSGQTVVIYMGLGALSRITDRLEAHGLAPATPVAVIENGTTPEERVIRGTLADIADRARAADVRAPALIVVGEVAARASVHITRPAMPAAATAL